MSSKAKAEHRQPFSFSDMLTAELLVTKQPVAVMGVKLHAQVQSEVADEDLLKRLTQGYLVAPSESLE